MDTIWTHLMNRVNRALDAFEKAARAGTPAETADPSALWTGMRAYSVAALLSLVAAWTGCFLAVACAGIGALIGAIAAPLALLHALLPLLSGPYAIGIDWAALALAALGGAGAGALAGFGLVFGWGLSVGLPIAYSTVMAGLIVGAVLTRLLYEIERPLLEWRGGRRLSWDEETRLLPLLEEAGAALGIDPATLPAVLITDTSVPRATARMRALVLTAGLLEALDDEELSGVLAHELAHWQRGHAAGQRFVWAVGLPLAAAQWVALVLTTSRSRILAAAGWAFFWPVTVVVRWVIAPVYARHSRDCEDAADAATVAAGERYRVGLARALAKLSVLETPQGTWEAALTRSHPPTALRIERLVTPEEAARRDAIRAQRDADRARRRDDRLGL